MSRPSVIVVGGGFAGIAAAHALQPTHDVRVLEAADRLGGRTWTERLDDDISVDRGGHFLGRDHKRAMALVDELGLRDQIIDYLPGFGPDPVSVCHLEGNRLVTRRSKAYFGIQGLDARAPWGEQARFIYALIAISTLCALVPSRNPASSRLGRRLDRMTWADFIDRFNVPAWFSDLMYSGVRGVWSQDPEQMSLLYVLWYMKTNGGFSKIFNDQGGGPQQFGLRCGLGHMLTTWAQRLANEPRLDCAVSRIEIGDGQCKVYPSSGHSLTADAVVLAVGPGITGRIDIDPPLPETVRRLHQQPRGFAIKSVVFYETPWWRQRPLPDDHIFAWLNGRGTHGVDWILDSSAEDESYYALTCFVSPELVDSCAATDMDLDQAIADGIARLSQDERAARPTRMVTTDWRTVPWVEAGPNTNFGPGVLTSVAPLWNSPHQDRLFFAAAEYASQFCGYVEGAIASGREAARQIQRLR